MKGQNGVYALSGEVMKPVVRVLASLCMAVSLSGCGDGGSGSVTSTQAPGVGMTKQKYQVLIPKPQHHESGESSLQWGSSELLALRDAAQAASRETSLVVEAQLMQRLPDAKQLSQQQLGQETFHVEFLHPLPDWTSDSWLPMRERNETYGLFIDAGNLRVDAQTSWALANAMSTLYQLMEVKMLNASTGEGMSITLNNGPHTVIDSPAFPHRGMLLDTSRTFYPVSWIKDLLVQFGEFKLNVLHLHLTDTSAWSIDIETHPELSEHASYRDIDGTKLSYSRADIQDLVEFARRRGVSLLPEIDGPVHAPSMASGPPLEMTVAAGVEFSTDDYGVEPPVGTWNFSDARVTGVLNDVFQQLNTDFSTAPFLHVGGDEPRASALCEAMTNQTLIAQCIAQCTSVGGGTPYQPICSPMPSKPAGETETYWFPDVLNEKVQAYFDAVIPQEATIPTVAWSGVREDMGVQLPKQPRLPSGTKPAMQLWQYPRSADYIGLTEDDCDSYDIIQSSATHPQTDGANGTTDEGWLYLECGEGENWIAFRQNYWCSRASWISLYSLNLTQHSAKAASSEKCQRAFVGAEMGIWGEITGTGNSMALIFPRAVAFAERAWTNPPALLWSDLASNGAIPAQYYYDHIREVVHRLNTVVENFDLQGLGVDRLQPKFCFDHPEYCDKYSDFFFPESADSDFTVV